MTLLPVLILALISLAADASSQLKRPMPPVLLSVDLVPISAESVVSNVFLRRGVAIEVRMAISQRMKALADSDLVYLAKNLDPQTIGFARPDNVEPADWAQLVPAYAEAALADRKRKLESLWQVAVGSAVPVLTLIGGMLIERRRNRNRPIAAAAPTSLTQVKPRTKKRRK